jgi:aconitase A
MKNNKAIIIVSIILFVVVISIILFFVFRKKKADTKELEAQLDALRAQLADPKTPVAAKPNLIDSISNLIKKIKEEKEKKKDEVKEVKEVNWVGGGVGICVNPAKLDVTKVLSSTTTECSEVCQLQDLLNKKGSALTVDGKFGTKTTNALKLHFALSSIALKDITKGDVAVV